MGEPLANYKRVVAAVRRITDPVPDGFGISQRSWGFAGVKWVCAVVPAFNLVVEFSGCGLSDE